MGYWNKRIAFLGVVVIALVAIACGTDEPSSSPTATPAPTGTVVSDLPPAGDPPPADPTTDAGQLALARARWAALDISDYDVTMSLQCFCPLNVSKMVDLKVRDGVIARGVRPAGSDVNTEIVLERYRTVEGLFDFVADAIEQEAHSITAIYHPEHGYPESVFVDFVSNIADEEHGFTIEKITAAAFGNTAADELAAARGLWLAADLRSYSFTFQQLCFCPQEITQPVLIEVRYGQVEAVSRPGSELQLDPPSISDYLPVEGLFDLVQGAIDRDADVIEVEYHTAFGYPVSAFFDYVQVASDEELKFEVSGLIGGDGFLGDSSEADLLAARTLWQEGVGNYQFVFEWHCFCGLGAGVSVEIEVRRNAIVSVRPENSDALLEPSELGKYMTVEGLFGFIKDGFDRNAARVRVTYDPVLGYPAEAWIDYSLNIIDEERGFSLADFSPN
ncbi:MAG: hypothetical protein IIC93_00885 [Chloroflexi bacterium]|nr:hypothetical protein [Chloroflexota bacterium]